MAQPKNNASQEAGAAMPATPPRENLIRGRNDGDALTVTRDSADSMPVLHGHAAVFNQWTEINSVYEGRFLERMAPGAFTKTISEGRDRIKVLFQHGKDPQIGDKPLGPLRTLEEDAYGLRYEVPLLDTAYNRELIPGLDAGLYGASFRFSVMQEKVNKRPAKSEHNPLGLTERSVIEAKVPELGPVTFGAYAGATSGLRSMTDAFLLDSFLADEPSVERLAEAIAAKSRRQTFSVSFNGVPMTPTEEIAEPEEVRDEFEPEPSEATTPDPGLEPEPPVATTRAVTPNKGLYPNREEKPAWLL